MTRLGFFSRRRFAVAATSALVLIALVWLFLNRFDDTLGRARFFLSSDSAVIAEIGGVDATTLYKLRYLDAAVDPQKCFAEYFFFVSGASGATLNVRVQACGSRRAPQFSWAKR
jgi:hypothetical protein